MVSAYRARFAGLAPAILVAACGAGHHSSATTLDIDGGSDGGPSFTYTPQGCSYSYTPPSSLGYTGLAVDDSGPVDPVNGVPQRVRLGLGGETTKGQPGYADPTTTAAFTWETAESDHAAKVKMGTDPASLTQVSTGYTWTAQASIGNTDSYFHEVHVCGLTPDTTYFYEVGGGPPGAEVWSATQSFTTMPSNGPITIGIFGDARDASSTWQAVHLRMKNAGITMSLVGGDVVDSAGIESLYATWLDAIWHDPNDASAFLTLGQQFILPINGNHENDLTMSFANWAIPGDGPYAETYASFDLGNTHFMMIDDQHIGLDPTSAETAAQLQWVAQDLAAAAADRANHPFIVAIGHRCMFSSSTHGTDSDVLAARAALVPLYDRYAVDLVVNGHDHDYERTKPLHGGNPASGAPVVGTGTTYVVTAGAGADAYPTGTPQPFTQISVAYGSGTSYIGSYSTLALQGNTITLTAYGLKASSNTMADDDVIDTLTLTH